jgi:hypothetical protein
MRFVVCLAVLGLSTAALAFSQKAGKGGSIAPIGHEYLTMQAAKDVGLPDFNDTDARALATKYQANLEKLQTDGTLEKMGWKVGGFQGFVQSWWQGIGTQSRFEEFIRYSLSAADTYMAKPNSLNAYSAAMGQRWVDEMGFPQMQQQVATGCFNVVAQEPEENMADHFMRRGDDLVTTETAYNVAMARLKKYFAAAVTADDVLIPMRDGGISGGYYYLVSKPYFLLGRVAHLVQDSFSPEHTIRGTGATFVMDPPYYSGTSTENDYSQIAEIKDWDCAPNTYQHKHVGASALVSDMNVSGDLIWKKYSERENTTTATVADLKPVAKAAYNATQDLYRAFVAARARWRQERVQKAGERGPGYNPAQDLDAFITRWMTLNRNIPIPKQFVNANVHRPDCQKLPNKELSVSERKAKEATRNKLRQACLVKTARLSSDAKEPDYNKPPFFWTGGEGTGENRPTPALFLAERAKTTDDLLKKTPQPTLRRTQSTGDLPK